MRSVPPRGSGWVRAVVLTVYECTLTESDSQNAWSNRRARRRGSPTTPGPSTRAHRRERRGQEHVDERDRGRAQTRPGHHGDRRARILTLEAAGRPPVRTPPP